MQDDAPDEENVLARQGVGVVEESGQKEPAGHNTHADDE